MQEAWTVQNGTSLLGLYESELSARLRADFDAAMNMLPDTAWGQSEDPAPEDRNNGCLSQLRGVAKATKSKGGIRQVTTYYVKRWHVT